VRRHAQGNAAVGSTAYRTSVTPRHGAGFRVAAGLALTLLLLLAAAAPAFASKAVVGFMGGPLNSEGYVPSSELGGLFNTVGDTAVNAAGGGAASPGDIYVVDSGNNRVQQFSAKGAFIRAWGQGVVAAGAPNDNGAGFEICDTTAGNVVSDCRGGTSSPPEGGALRYPVGIAVNETTGDVYVGNTELRRVDQFDASGHFIRAWGKNVLEDGAANTGFEICPAASAGLCRDGEAGTTAGAFGNPSFPGLTSSGHLAVAPAGAPNAGNVLVPDNGSNARIQEFTADGDFVRAFGWDVIGSGPNNEPRDEQQEITITATSGTFTLTFTTQSGPEWYETESQTTAPIPFDATAAEVDAALEALSNIPAGDIAVSGGPGDISGSNPYVVTFSGSFADTDVRTMVLDNSNLRTDAGQTLTCIGTVEPEGVDRTPQFQWLRNGVEIPGATSAEYTTVAADAGGTVQCRVTAPNTIKTENANAIVGGAQVSNPATVVNPHPTVDPPIAPEGIPAPTSNAQIDTGGLGGQVLTCNTGTWQGSPTFTYQWFNKGAPIPGATKSTYVTSSVDVAGKGVEFPFDGPAFQCAVTGTNAGGSVTKLSESLTNGNITYQRPSAKVPNTLGSLRTIAPGGNFEVCTGADCKEGVVGVEPGQFVRTGPSRVAVDSTGAIYTVESSFENNRVQKFTPTGGTPALAPEVFAPELLSGTGETSEAQAHAPTDIAIGPDDHVLVVKHFLKSELPICPDGKPAADEGRVLEVSSDGDLLDVHMSCARLLPSTYYLASSLSANVLTGEIYVGNYSENRVYILADPTPPVVAVDAPTPTPSGAVLTGTVNPMGVGGYLNPPATTFHAEYKLPGESEWTAFGGREKLAGAGTAPAPFKISVVGLLANTDYEVRVVATKEFNAAQTISPPQSFKTLPAPPAIQSFSTSHVTASSADLEAVIDPRGTATTYHFEYGPTAAYGTTVPVPDGDVGDGQGGKQVTVHIEGLEPVTYHFRVIATSAAGTTVSEDQTFTYYAPDCPNTQVRQQTASNFLPDCRAYEIASAADSGGTLLFPSSGVNSGYATGPGRLGYMANFGTISDTGEPINTFGDFYVSTRTDSGWTTKYIGLPSGTSSFVGPRIGFEPEYVNAVDKVQRDVLTNPQMSRFVMWNWGNIYNNLFGNEVSPEASNAPYVFDAEGNLVDRWPTNLTEVPGGSKFVGEMRTSQDLSHFVFSSDIPFLPGGVPGDVYDNDTVNRTVSIASRDSQNQPIEAQPVQVSADGSHILMTTGINGACCQVASGALYMRVDGSVSYDVSQGQDVEFAGMTKDGGVVYMTSNQQLTDDDLDASRDIFVWEESDPDQLKRVSVGVGDSGNADSCDSIDEWAAKCGATPVSEYERACASACDTYPRFFASYATLGAGLGGNGLSDNFLASASGAMYFYSPEQLTGPGEGASDQQNLYLYRDGEVRFVASLTPGKICLIVGNQDQRCSRGPIARMQVSPDGRFAAFLTKSQLTASENANQPSMYLYDADRETLTCVSCPPNGDPPTSATFGSQNGLFMTDDGRTFFSTEDPLVPKDTNLGPDVYEYVEGRPQLISQGTGSVVQLTPFYAVARPGLIGVSANGVDAFFSTYDVLTPYDKNGGKLKVYDARTNGGFSFILPPPPCAAADECHGDTSQAPGAVTQGTSGALGGGGNVVHKKAKRKKCQRKKKQVRRVKCHGKKKKHSASKGNKTQGRR
jgi:hypothetical protein